MAYVCVYYGARIGTNNLTPSHTAIPPGEILRKLNNYRCEQMVVCIHQVIQDVHGFKDKSNGPGDPLIKRQISNLDNFQGSRLLMNVRAGEPGVGNKTLEASKVAADRHLARKGRAGATLTTRLIIGP